MTAQLLITKFFIPPARAQLVPRPELIERLNDGLVRKLTLISAPAGFGKTTLVIDWVESLQGLEQNAGQTKKFAWLSLDQDDNDLVRFLTYFVTALTRIKRIDPDLGQGALNMLQTPQSPPLNLILISLINDLVKINDKIIFVLDDFHLIETDVIHQAIDFLLENMPRQLHLVITTRQDPLLSLGRLRVRAQMIELRAADLRFSSTEAADFLNRVMGLNISSEEIAQLETHTEGWIAGLQLAAISMRGRSDPKAFIQSFAGSNRMVLDFLISEVLSQQLDSIQNFLLQTAILDRMTGSLCDALTGQDNGQEILEELERANLFIIPLDDDRRWYRYHHLFAELLRHRVRQTQSDHLLTMNLKASKWFQDHGFFDESIVYALRGKGFSEAARMITRQVDFLWERGEHGKLRQWLAVLPEKVLLQEPTLGSIQAYYLHTIGQYQQGEQLLRKVEQLLREGDTANENPILSAPFQMSDQEKKNLLGRISVFRGLISSNIGDIQGMIKHANQALKNLPEDDLVWRGIATFALGDAYSFTGDMSASYKVRSQALSACQMAGNFYYIMMANLKLVATLREQGRLEETAKICKKQIAIAEEKGLLDNNSVGYLMTLLGEISVEWNDLSHGIDLVRKGVAIASQNKNVLILSFCYLNLLRVLFSNGNLSEMEDLISSTSSNYSESPIAPWFPGQLTVWQVKIWLVQGDSHSVSKWAKANDSLFQTVSQLPEEIDFHSLFLHILTARVLTTQGKFDQSVQILLHLERVASETERITSLIEIRLLLALTYQSNGEIDQALEALENAISLTRSKGYFRIFVDEGPQMASLLYEALKRNISPEYVQKLLAAFPVDESDHAGLLSSRIDQSELIEPLSEREIEVLQLIARGMSNQSIAERLVLSIHTIKAHTRTIYRKLAVHNRTQAVAKARTIGIFPEL